MEHLCSKSGQAVQFFCPKCQIAECFKCYTEDHMLTERPCPSMIRLSVKKKSVREAVQLQMGLATSKLRFAGIEADSQLSRLGEKYKKIGEKGRSLKRNREDLTRRCQLVEANCQNCEQTGDDLIQQCRAQAQKLKELVKPNDQFSVGKLVKLQVENAEFDRRKSALLANRPQLDLNETQRLLDVMSRLERDVLDVVAAEFPVGNEVKEEIVDNHDGIASGTPSNSSLVENLRNYLAEEDETNPTDSPTAQDKPTEDQEEESLADSTESEAPPKRNLKRRVSQHNGGANVSPRKSSRFVGKTLPNYAEMAGVSQSDEEESDDESDVGSSCGQVNRSVKVPPDGSAAASIPLSTEIHPEEPV